MLLTLRLLSGAVDSSRSFRVYCSYSEKSVERVPREWREAAHFVWALIVLCPGFDSLEEVGMYSDKVRSANALEETANALAGKKR